jgi:hypothetical protein
MSQKSDKEITQAFEINDFPPEFFEYFGVSEGMEYGAVF